MTVRTHGDFQVESLSICHECALSQVGATSKQTLHERIATTFKCVSNKASSAQPLTAKPKYV